jgi:hypothetical protein
MTKTKAQLLSIFTTLAASPVVFISFIAGWFYALVLGGFELGQTLHGRLLDIAQDGKPGLLTAERLLRNELERKVKEFDKLNFQLQEQLKGSGADRTTKETTK